MQSLQSKLLHRIGNDLLIPIRRLDYILRSAPYRYKVYTINKKSGNGKRVIAQPAKEVKAIQYWIINNLLNGLRQHGCAYAYTKNRSIKDNAQAHISNSYLIKLDFENFFNSIKDDDFIHFCSDSQLSSLNNSDIQYLLRALFWAPNRNDKLCLSIGAPSSPLLSNLIMFNFDSTLHDYCHMMNLTYTRYADDITISTNNKNIHRSIIYHVERILKGLAYPKLKINKNKTILASKANRRIITGLILSNEDKISLGRDRKRLISAMIHHVITKPYDLEKAAQLRGLLAFANDVEPDFLERMKTKYGESEVTAIMKGVQDAY